MSMVDAAEKVLHNSDNQVARALYGHAATCLDTDDAISVYIDIKFAYSHDKISESEYEALLTVYDNVCYSGLVKKCDRDVVSIFRQSIWSATNFSQVAQFRNCVTDMYMLEFISFEEYAGLNNEIDKYIQYTISNGGLK